MVYSKLHIAPNPNLVLTKRCYAEKWVRDPPSLEPDRYILYGYRSGDKRSELLPRGVIRETQYYTS